MSSRGGPTAGRSEPSGADAGRSRVLLLGPCVVEHADGSVTRELTAVQRKVLARLAMGRPGAVEADALIEAVWGSEPPATARTSLHNQISRIRRLLGAHAILTDKRGCYQLTLPTDVEAALDALGYVEQLLHAGEAVSAHQRSSDALALFRGAAFEDLDTHHLSGMRLQFEELHRSLETLRLASAIAAGFTAWAIPEGERLVAVAPHDERRWALLVRALGAAGRRGDALGACDRARRAIADELGLSPGDDLRAAEAEVLGVAQGGQAERRLRTVGRSELIEETVRAAVDGSSIVLVGESGIGKTRVLEEASRALARRGFAVARAAFPLHPGTATVTLVTLLHELDSELDPRLPPVTSFTGAVQHAARRRRVALCVDDVDRAGPTSIAALRSAAGHMGVVVVAASTNPDTDLQSFAKCLEVDPLAPDALAELVEQAAGGPADPEQVAWIHSMSGGNPSFAEQLLDDVASGASHLVEPSEGARSLIRERLERIDAATRLALEIAAVCGPIVPAPLLRELAPDAGIGGLITSSLLEEATPADIAEAGLPASVHGDVLVFRHGVVRETVHDDLAPGRRAELHHAVARFLADLGADAGVVAAHAVAAADLDRADARNWAWSAGTDASKLGAHAEAASWYGTASEVASASGDRHRNVEALIARADSLRMAGSPEQEQALFEAVDAATALGDPDLIADATFALLQLGATTESGSLHEQAVAAADAALAVVRDPDRRAMIAGAASLTHSMTGASDRCRELFLDAVSAAEDDAVRRAVLPFAYLGIGHPSDLPLREELTAELLERGEAADDPIALFEGHQLAFSVALQRADGDRLRDSYAELESLIVRLGDVGRRWATLYHRAAVQHLEGDLEAAEATSEEALELFAPTSPSRALATHGGQLLPIRLAQGRFGELRDVFEALVVDQPGVPAWRAALALAVADDPERADDLAASALDGVAEDFTWLAAHLIGGRAVALAGSEVTLARYLERLQPWSGLVCWQGTCSYGPVDTVLALLHHRCGNLAEATHHADLALELVASLGAPVFEPELVELRRSLGDGFENSIAESSSPDRFNAR